MKIYTAIYSKHALLDPQNPIKRELHCVLYEADSIELARHIACKQTPAGQWMVKVEEADTRHLHPGAQDTIFLPAQVDITEVVS